MAQAVPSGRTAWSSITADGPIVDGSVSAAASIVAGTAELIAGTGIATGSGADAQLEIDVTTLAATTVTGNIHILDTAGGVTIGDSDPNPHEGSSYTKGVSITAVTGDYNIVVRASSLDYGCQCRDQHLRRRHHVRPPPT